VDGDRRGAPRDEAHGRRGDRAAVVLSAGHRSIRRSPGPAAAAGAHARRRGRWRAALEAWAESQRAYAAALWGWARSCDKDGEAMPRLIFAWARVGEEWFNEEEAKKKVCVGVAAALAAIMEAGGMAVVGYGELMLEVDAMERERGVAGRDDESTQN
jgi:hypothetical protein